MKRQSQTSEIVCLCGLYVAEGGTGRRLKEKGKSTMLRINDINRVNYITHFSCMFSFYLHGEIFETQSSPMKS